MSASSVLTDEQRQTEYTDSEGSFVPGVAENQAEVVYPESDGAPMGETGFHVHATLHLYQSLRHAFRNAPDVYVAADMFMYYEQGNPRAVKAPDVMVIKGVPNDERRTFKLWEEHQPPAVIFEISSKSTMIDDLVVKSILYASLGVREYFIFDPLHEYLEAQLVGFVLEAQEYRPLEPEADGSLVSQELGLLLVPDAYRLRLADLHTREPIPALDEAVAKAEQEAQRAQQEAERAQQEAERAQQEAQRAQQEAERADAAEAEVARLRAML